MQSELNESREQREEAQQKLEEQIRESQRVGLEKKAVENELAMAKDELLFR